MSVPVSDFRSTYQGPLGSAGELQGALAHLRLLADVYLHLPKVFEERVSVIARVGEIWDQFLRRVEREVNADLCCTAFEELKSNFEEVGVFPLYDTVYYPSIVSSSNADEIRVRAAAHRANLACLHTEPFRSAARGVEGPTILVQYPGLGGHSVRRFVVKWPYNADIPAHRIVEIFGQSADLGFSVPKMSVITLPVPDIEWASAVHESTRGQRVSLDRSESDRLIEDLFAIRQAIGNEQPFSLENSQVMVGQLVNGSDLVDFFQHRYVTLTRAQKGELFKALGRLAMFDYFSGHNDRLVAFSYENGQFVFGNEEGINLGNAMVTISDEGRIQIWAIDNGLSDELLEDSKKSARYTQFVQSSVLSARGEDRSYILAIRLQEDLMQSIRKSSRISPDTARIIGEDLAEFGTQSAQRGFVEMEGTIRTSLSRLWVGAEGEALKAYLRAPTEDFRLSCAADFVPYLEARFAALKGD